VAEAEKAAEAHDRVSHLAAALVQHHAFDLTDVLAVRPIDIRTFHLVTADEVRESRAARDFLPLSLPWTVLGLRDGLRSVGKVGKGCQVPRTRRWHEAAPRGGDRADQRRRPYQPSVVNRTEQADTSRRPHGRIIHVKWFSAIQVVGAPRAARRNPTHHLVATTGRPMCRPFYFDDGVALRIANAPIGPRP
jgi:hypothetical protein